ncbi:MAG: SRPBCC domain-containing protein [Candidatus Lutibacillus vidarii]|jgi:uncharacterized protein YndB with AHSA1/START domain|nr:SRPBCC domain-containing protein [Candidatus Lutibacillus vidarii]HON74865.1 SRPBCC domain-containing protein [Dermatophilaceae bacterium]HRB99825.1 SRPBCC domain-containing protein [Dermatophilaceae bacterium]
MTDIASSPLDTDLCVHVDRRVDHPVGHVWGVVNSPQGVEAWLGSGAKLGGKGEHWYAADGSQGVLRSYHPAEQIRVSWHASDEAPASLVDLRIIPDGAGTRLDLRHEHLSAGDDLEALRAKWSAALADLATLAG